MKFSVVGRSVDDIYSDDNGSAFVSVCLRSDGRENEVFPSPREDVC